MIYTSNDFRPMPGTAAVYLVFVMQESYCNIMPPAFGLEPVRGCSRSTSTWQGECPKIADRMGTESLTASYKCTESLTASYRCY